MKTWPSFITRNRWAHLSGHHEAFGGLVPGLPPNSSNSMFSWGAKYYSPARCARDPRRGDVVSLRAPLK